MSGDPVGLTLLIASTALKTAGSLAQGRAAQAQANYQAAIQNQQAQLQRQQAERERQLTAVQEVQLRRQQSRELAAMRVRLAAGGRDTTTGSALLLQEDAAAQNEFAALLNRSLGLERAQAFANQANLSTLNAAGERFRGAAARQSSYYGAGSSLLGGTRDIRTHIREHPIR